MMIEEDAESMLTVPLSLSLPLQCNDEEDAGSMLTVPLQRRQPCRSE